MSNEQGAGFYRFQVGDFEVASVSDGFLHFENPKTMIAAGASDKEFHDFMQSKFLPSTSAYFQINSLYVDTGKHKVLMDNGMGPYLGPSGGHLPDHLRSLGVAPEEIDTIIISHAHLDHVLSPSHPMTPRCPLCDWRAGMDLLDEVLSLFVRCSGALRANAVVLHSNDSSFPDTAALTGHLRQ